MASSKQILPSLVPFELVEEILYRIPVESLVRFKLMSKQWYALFNDKRFIYKLLDLSKERFIQVDDNSFQLSNLETKAFLCQPTPDELNKYMIVNMIHCDGLLLCKCHEKGRCDDTSEKLAVWNPVLSRIKWIEPSSSYKFLDAYGFGYDNVSRDNYKILRIDTTSDNKGKSLEIEIYEFKSKLWRSVDATLECYPSRKHVSMNGNMYWIAQKKMADTKTETFIESFDFSIETFKPICRAPNGIDCFRVRSGYIVVLSCFGGDRLSLLHEHEHVRTEVWVTSKVTDDGIVSWSKYFNVTSGPPILCSILLTNFIFNTSNDIYINVYELGDEGEIKKQVEIIGRHRRGDDRSCNVYVPSLVPVPESEDIKRGL